jgi:hypothetical protein
MTFDNNREVHQIIAAPGEAAEAVVNRAALFRLRRNHRTWNTKAEARPERTTRTTMSQGELTEWARRIKQGQTNEWSKWMEELAKTATADLGFDVVVGDLINATLLHFNEMREQRE